jgi:NAD(P)-dependent dehydrogenase (short-subunit alcohol dehydrogenase family)
MSTFGRESTTDDVLAGIDLSGKHALVTGASAGLGVETVRALAAHGAKVTMAVRDLAKGQAALDEIRAAVPDAELELREVDLASQASVRAFDDAFTADHPTLDLFIANAGIMACPQGTTVDGFELQLGTNHLGHYAMARALLPLLQATPGSRTVLLSSRGHRMGDVDLDDPWFERTPYDAWNAYGRSKTANVLTAVALDRRLADHGGQAFAVHPGGIVTELGRHLTRETMGQLRDFQQEGEEIFWKTVPQGAATTCYAATSPDLDGRRAWYLEDCHLAEITDDPTAGEGVRAYAVDPERAEALWSRSEEWLADKGFGLP